MLLSTGTTIGRTPADRCPGSCSDAAFFRYDHRSYPRQTTARAAAQMPLSAGTTIGRTPADHCPGRCSDAAFFRYDHRSYPGRPLPGPQLCYRFLQVRPSVVPLEDHCPGYRSDAAFRRYDHRSYPRQTSARAAAQMLLSAGTTIGRTPGRPLPGPLLRCCFPQVRPSVVPPADHCPGRCLDAALHRYDHRSYPRQTTARATAQMLLSTGTTIGRTPPADHCPGYCSDAALHRYDHRSYPR